MSVSDWISIICAGVSLIVTIVIAVLQIRQSSRMNKFELRQDERDEQRHAESVKARAVSFLSKYYSNRGLIPLCAIAAMHNDLFYYSREMYREFCCMTLEVQNRILEYCRLDLRVIPTHGVYIDEFYYNCIGALVDIFRKHFPEDKDIFYDGGKYILRSLERYGKYEIPNQEFEYHIHLTKVLSEAFTNRNVSDKPVEQLCQDYNFAGCDEINACQFTTMVAEYIAIYGDENTETDKNYGTPGEYAGETIDTMEDLFLLTLFEIYVCLILKEMK